MPVRKRTGEENRRTVSRSGRWYDPGPFRMSPVPANTRVWLAAVVTDMRRWFTTPAAQLSGR